MSDYLRKFFSYSEKVCKRKESKQLHSIFEKSFVSNFNKTPLAFDHTEWMLNFGSYA